MNSQKVLGSSLVVFSLVLLIIFTFIKIEQDEEGAFLCSAVAANPDLSMENCPAHNSNTSWLILVAFGIAILILGSGIVLFFFFQQKKSDEPKTFKEVDQESLSEEEKKVYAFLKGHEGSSYQSDVMKTLEWSKVQTTRVLDRLEAKGILERKRRGMTNIVVLK